MKRMIAMMAGVAVLALGGCRDNDEQAAGAPAAEGTAGTTTPAATTPGTRPPADAGSAEQQCLVSGSPWQVSKPDLESQIQGVMRGINVTGVHITGDQTLTVTAGLKATFADDTVSTITADMSNGLTMVVTQKHHGSASGQWKVAGNKLSPTGSWTGGIKVDTKVSINGRSANAPVTMPTDTLGDVAMNYTCVDGVLNLTVPGSPFVYMFR